MMNNTAVLSADWGGLSAQQKAVKVADLIDQGWKPTTAQVAETFALTFSGAYKMMCRISAVKPLVMEVDESQLRTWGRDRTRWEKFDYE